MKQALVEDGAEVKAGQPFIVSTNAAGQINAQEDPKIRVQEARFKYEHDLLDIAHQISKLKGHLARPKVLLDANAIALPIYQQEQEAYAYKLKLSDATASSGEAATVGT